MKKNSYPILSALLLLLFITMSAGISLIAQPETAIQPTEAAPTLHAKATGTPAFSWPISDAPARITKLFFGLYVSPQHSPVNSKRFIGYHTGVDFETTPAEADLPVTISTICAGNLIVKRYASGYGGVAVQSCLYQGHPITVIYGHLKLSSITAPLNKPLAQGATLGVLGKGQSKETDGERKHLHLSIHRGYLINILGYVQRAKELSGWIDPQTILSK